MLRHNPRIIPDYSMVADNEGRVISSLSLADLQQLKARCIAYFERKPDSDNHNIILLCNAVDHYISKELSVSIQDAFDRFAELRRQAIRMGYVTPPIAGAPSVAEISEANKLLEECIACAEPLPGEADSVTRRITEACQREIKVIIEAINAGQESPYPVKRGGNG